MRIGCRHELVGRAAASRSSRHRGRPRDLPHAAHRPARLAAAADGPDTGRRREVAQAPAFAPRSDRRGDDRHHRSARVGRWSFAPRPPTSRDLGRHPRPRTHHRRRRRRRRLRRAVMRGAPGHRRAARRRREGRRHPAGLHRTGPRRASSGPRTRWPAGSPDSSISPSSTPRAPASWRPRSGPFAHRSARTSSTTRSRRSRPSPAPTPNGPASCSSTSPSSRATPSGGTASSRRSPRSCVPSRPISSSRRRASATGSP